MLIRLAGRGSRRDLGAPLLASLAFAAIGCGGSPATKSPEGTVAPAATPVAVAEEPLPPPSYESSLPEGLREHLYDRFTGDFDHMVKRRVVRVGTSYNRTFYFVDKGEQRGVVYEMADAFENQINKKLRTTNATSVRVVIIPLPKDQLGRALLDGKIDCAVGQAIVRPELQAIVDFTRPTRTNVNEVLVTGPGASPVASVDDLSGKDVYARKGSSAWESLAAQNEKLKAKGRPPVSIREVPGNLEDDDLLEMVNVGLIPAIVAQDYLARFWSKVFTHLEVHDTVALRTGASLGVALRKDSPRLKAELDAFLAKNGLGTAFGNTLEKRYLVSTTFVENAASEAERRKFQQLVGYFKKYSQQYQLDYLLMAAQGYQESRLDQNAKSKVGAVGIMQVMPATGRDLNVGDITKPEANVHAGVKYMRFMVDRYYKDEPMDQLDKGLFTFASYNAGPARVAQLRREAAKRGLDPNVWFGNVEQIASERVGRETVTYVSNIYKYYVAYKLIEEERARREEAKKALQASSK
jgi:membrane-bound lytic murein transglycosylase MltF